MKKVISSLGLMVATAAALSATTHTAHAWDPQNGPTWSVKICTANGVEQGGSAKGSRAVCQEKAKTMKAQGRKIIP